MKESTCTVCERSIPRSEPLQITLEGEVCCADCVARVTAHVKAALRPEARDDGR
jgi:hypothetical protein